MSNNISSKSSVGSNSTASLNSFQNSLNSSSFSLTNVVLGEGGYGTVFRGISQNDEHPVAIKICQSFKSACNEEIMAKRIQGSLYALKYYGSYVNSFHKPALVFQQYGISIRNYLRTSQKILQLTDILKIFQSCLKCVVQLKQANIIHRDLKIDNFLIKQNKNNKNKYQIKICDFGLATQLTESCKNNILAKVGTTAYKSPQTLHFGEHTYKSEVWSMGIVLFQMLYRKLPFENQIYKNQQSLYLKLISTLITFPHVNQEIRAIGELCLNPNPLKRIQIENLLKNVDKIIDNFAVSQTAPESSIINQTPLISIMIELVSSLKRAIENLSTFGPTQKKLKTMLQLILQKYADNRTYVLQILDRKSLLEYLSKLRIITQIAKTKKQIILNFNQFMIIDNLLILLKVIEMANKSQNEVLPSINTLYTKYVQTNKTEQTKLARYTQLNNQLKQYLP